MGIKIRDSGGTLRTITQIRMRDAGNVLRTIKRVRIRDSGNVLRTVWQATTIALLGKTYFYSFFAGTVSVGYSLTSGGKEQYYGDASGFPAPIDIGDWVLPNSAASGFDARMTMTGGTTFSSGSGAGVWLNLGTTRTWVVSSNTYGSKQATANVEIRDAFTLSVVATATIDLTADHS